MKTAVLFSNVTDHSPADDLDVLAQVEAVSRSLANLGHEPFSIPMSLDLESARQSLLRTKPHFVFNLVESLNGMGRFIHFAPALLDQLHLPYSGSPTHTLYLSTDKVRSKSLLITADLPTPPWLSSADGACRNPDFPPPWFVKPVWEDASVGIDESSLVNEIERLAEVLKAKVRDYGDCLVEAYIAGREFNLSLLAGDTGPEVLPAAEMVFRDYPPDKPTIVGYAAKWHEDSFEYQNTARRFDFRPADAALLQRMKDIALSCWRLFQLRGYARVDFRVDERGPWVLEVNANPCISPDSGFVAAAERAGLDYNQMINRIIKDTLGNHVPHPSNP